MRCLNRPQLRVAQHPRACSRLLRTLDRRAAARRRCVVKVAFAEGVTSERDEQLVAANSPSFEGLGIDQRLAVMLPELGVKLPSEIQEQAIPTILQGRTLAIQSFTGSGKARVKTKKGSEDDGLEAIIVAPSRELAMQTLRVAQQLLPPEAWPLVQQCIGGANGRYQLEALRRNKPLVVIGTPGRLAEHSRSGALRSHRCGTLVMDEVDQLLCPQFRDDMLRLVQHTGSKLPDGPQFVMASATLTSDLISSIQNLLGTRNSIPIATPYGAFPDAADARASSGSAASTAGRSAPAAGPSWGWGPDSGFWEGKTGVAPNRSSAGGLLTDSMVRSSLPPQLEHAYVTEVRRHHIDAVRRVVFALNAERVIVFMNFQDRLRDAMFKLASKGLSVAVLHGEIGKQQRQTVLEGFRTGKYRVLLVSDVVCRGLDITDCDAVINLELPSNPAHYAHRAGRTGRMGRHGTVVSVIEKQQQYVVEKLGKALAIDVQAAKLLGGQVTVIQDDKVVVLGQSQAGKGALGPAGA